MKIKTFILLSTVSLLAHNAYAQEGVSILSEIIEEDNKNVAASSEPVIVLEVEPDTQEKTELSYQDDVYSPTQDEGVNILSEVTASQGDAYKPSTGDETSQDIILDDEFKLKDKKEPDIQALKKDIQDIEEAETISEIESITDDTQFVSPQASPEGVDIFSEVVETNKAPEATTFDESVEYTDKAIEKEFDEPQAAPLLESSDDGFDSAVIAEEEVSDAQSDFYVGNLKRALQETYISNPRIKAQRQVFETTGETYNQALAGWLPTISLNYNKGRRRNRLDGEWNYVDMEDQQANIDQPLFRGGETWFLMDQANSLTKANAAQLITVTQDVMINAITAYTDVMRDREILNLSVENESVLKEQLDSSRSRYDLGEATKTDVAQSESRLARALSDVEQARGNLAVSVARFEEVVRRKPSDDLSPVQDLPPIPQTLEEVISLAQLHNPRVLTADHTESAAEDLVNINKARLLPDVTLRASAGRSEGTGFQGVDFDTDTVLINVNLPLYQGGAQYSRVRESKIQKSRRRFELLGVRNEIEQQAIQAWEGYRTAVAVIEAQDAAIEAAEIALDGVKQEQLYGSRTVLEVLDAKQELFIARVNRTRSERNKIVSWYNILSITGQLSPETLNLDLEAYDPEKEIERVKYQFIGF